MLCQTVEQKNEKRNWLKAISMLNKDVHFKYFFSALLRSPKIVEFYHFAFNLPFSLHFYSILFCSCLPSTQRAWVVSHTRIDLKNSILLNCRRKNPDNK